MRRLALAAATAAVCLLSASCAVADLADSSWPAFQGDSESTGYSPITVAGNTKLWEAKAGGGVSVGPDGTIYAVGNGVLTAINKDGSIKWRYNTGYEYGNRAPAVGSDGTIYFAATGSGNQGCYYAVKPNGTLRWSYQISNVYRTTAANIDSQGNVYFANDGLDCALLRSFTGDTGQLRWAKTVSNAGVGGSIAIGVDNTVYVHTFDWNTGTALCAYDSSGNQRWRSLTHPLNNSGPAIGPDGMIYIGDLGDTDARYPAAIYAIRPDGTKAWTALAGDGIAGTPAVAPDGTVYAETISGALYAYKNGRILWKYIPPQGVTGGMFRSPIVDGSGTIFYSGSSVGWGGYMIAVNPDGTQRWCFAAACGDGTNLALGANGELYMGGGLVACYVPEPSSIIALLCGITGPVALVMRRRK